MQYQYRGKGNTSWVNCDKFLADFFGGSGLYETRIVWPGICHVGHKVETQPDEDTAAKYRQQPQNDESAPGVSQADINLIDSVIEAYGPEAVAARIDKHMSNRNG